MRFIVYDEANTKMKYRNSNNDKILFWTSKGAAVEGVPAPDELKKTPGWPSLERLQKGPCAVIECIEKIPCNPCETACPSGAIRVGSPITNLPVLDEDKCTGCGVCITSCPGLAIFVVNLNYTEKSALISFPFEFLPLPKIGEEVSAVDRKGGKVCRAKVVKVLNKPKQDRTPIVSICVPKKFAFIVRGICLREVRKNSFSRSRDNENKMRVLKHPILGSQKLGKLVNITVDGKKIRAIEGEMIAAALVNAGIRVNRFTRKYSRPRGVFCGIGQCTDCVMIVNGIPNVRTCITPVESGMIIETQYGLGNWKVKN